MLSNSRRSCRATRYNPKIPPRDRTFVSAGGQRRNIYVHTHIRRVTLHPQICHSRRRVEALVTAGNCRAPKRRLLPIPVTPAAASDRISSPDANGLLMRARGIGTRFSHAETQNVNLIAPLLSFRDSAGSLSRPVRGAIKAPLTGYRSRFFSLPFFLLLLLFFKRRRTRSTRFAGSPRKLSRPRRLIYRSPSFVNGNVQFPLCGNGKLSRAGNSREI